MARIRKTEKAEKEKVLRKAFWSGQMDYEKWRRIIRGRPEGHAVLFAQSFVHLPMDFILHEMGTENFVKNWPAIQVSIGGEPPAEKRARDAWDALWGVTATGDSQYPVIPAVATLPSKRREILRLIIGRPGISAYRIARETGRDYSRVHKDIALLTAMGLVDAVREKEDVRKTRRLIPVHSVNAVLAGFTPPPLP